MELQSAVQKTLHSPEKCCMYVKQIQLNTKSDRILAVVERNGDYGIFVYQRTSPSLSLETVFPVNSDLKYQIDQTGIDPAPLSIKFGQDHLWLEVRKADSYGFVETLEKARKLYANTTAFGLPSSFPWIDRYGDALKTRQSQWYDQDEFDPLKAAPTTTQDKAANDWPWSHITTPTNGENCTIVDASAVSPMYDGKTVGFDDNFTSMNVSEKSSSLDKRQMDRNMEEDDKLTSLVGKHIKPVKPVGPRESIVKLYMSTLTQEYTDLQSFRVFCGTWNVNGQPAGNVDLRPWLAHDSVPPDLYALGFQELDLSKEAFIFGDSQREVEWYEACRKYLHPKGNYNKLKLIRLVGMMLIVFIDAKHTHQIKNLYAEQVGTGLLGMMGNKGGVAVRFDFRDTSICIVNVHLAAHVEEFERRNQDYRDINSRMQFKEEKNSENSICITDHDMIFWIGDLNYRLTGVDVDRVKDLISKKAYDVLLENDQLHMQMKMSRVFLDYKEAPITFQPTYKYDTGTDSWDTSEKCRCPAWCDRILWKGQHIENLEYRSHPILRISDHKPVSAIFDAQVQIINKENYKRVYEEVMKKLDKMENEFLPSVDLDKMEIQFGDVLFIEQKLDFLKIKNIGQVPVHFEFINKLDQNSYCKPWLQIKPHIGDILMDDEVVIEFEVYVNKDTAHMLNAGDDAIDDILVLHLEGGKDFFITVSGRYIPSCFGSSIESLVNMLKPIREIAKADLIQLEHIPTSPAGSTRRRSFFGENHPVLDVPKELWRLLDHIHRNGRDQEELFQQPGLHGEIQQIRDCLDTGQPAEIPGSIHSVVEALLIFLESLPEPVIPTELYHPCLDTAEEFEDCKKVLTAMPPYHHTVFVYLMAFLRDLLSNSHINKLEPGILAQLFGSTLLHCPPETATKEGKGRAAENKKRTIFIRQFLINEYDI